MLATNLTSCGSSEDKMRWAFRIFDVDQSGTTQCISSSISDTLQLASQSPCPGSIDLAELVEIICTFYDMEQVPREESRQHAARNGSIVDIRASNKPSRRDYNHGKGRHLRYY